MQYLTQFFLAEDRHSGVRSAKADGVLSSDSETVGFSFLQASHMSLRNADGLPLIPLLLSLFLILYQEACDFTASITVRPVPLQPHLCFVHINVVQVFGRTRWDYKEKGSYI